jgi:hypothetical protein
MIGMEKTMKRLIRAGLALAAASMAATIPGPAVGMEIGLRQATESSGRAASSLSALLHWPLPLRPRQAQR